MAEPNASPDAHAVVKAKKAPRMTYKQEIRTIQNLPKVQRFIVIMKIAGVFLVAIGLEGIVTANYVFSVVFIPLGIFVSLAPIKVRVDRCIACASPLAPTQAICPLCGAPQM